MNDPDSPVTQIEAIVAASGVRAAKAQAVADVLRRFGGYRWIGLYDVGPAEVVVIAWSGSAPPAHPRFRVTEGLTAAAIAAASTVVVDDVTTDPRYLETLGDTRSEMIVPVLVGESRAVRGTIDVESAEARAFSPADRALLEACAAAARPLWLEHAPAIGAYALPPGLPAPADDGACDHLLGQELPRLRLESSQGRVDLGELAAGRLVLYIYPQTGRPDRPTPAGWDQLPGARGCTPQSCGFRDHAAELAALGARVAGLSAQRLEEQVEFSKRNHMPFPVIADPARELAASLGLPTFEFDGATLYKRVTLIIERRAIVKVFYPVFPPDRNAEAVLAWLRAPVRSIRFGLRP